MINNKIKPEKLTEILLSLIQTIDRNTDETARLKEKQAEFMEKLWPELEKTETVKRMRKKKLISSIPLKDKVTGKVEREVLKVKIGDLNLPFALKGHLTYMKKKRIPFGVDRKKGDLEKRFCERIEDLLEFSDKELLMWKNFGPTKLNLVKTALNIEGIQFLEGTKDSGL